MALFTRQRAGKSASAEPPKQLPAEAPQAREPQPPADRHERVAVAAYYRWLARGGESGDSLQDWYEAEREIASAGAQDGRPR